MILQFDHKLSKHAGLQQGLKKTRAVLTLANILVPLALRDAEKWQ